MADKHNFTIDKGATFSRSIIYKDQLGIPIDLTGYTARMQIREYYNKPILHELNTENGGIVLVPLLGQIILSISAGVSDAFNVLDFIYDLELINGANVFRLIEGKVIVKENVTK